MVIAFLARTPLYDDVLYGQFEAGLYNGYVGTDEELPESFESRENLEDGDSLDSLVHVHGGITFDQHWEYNHPIIPLTEIPDRDTFYKLRIIGFDTCHTGDNAYKWNFSAVAQETLNLKKQIESIIDGK